jgi:hypothetical protein
MFVVRNIHGGYHMECPELPDGGCAPLADFPRIVWSLETAATWSPSKGQDLVLVVGGGVALPRGKAFSPVGDPGGVTGVGRVGLEIGGNGKVGFLLTFAAYARSLFWAKGTLTGGVVIPLR